jgi:ribose transport system ATP-binding protein
LNKAPGKALPFKSRLLRKEGSSPADFESNSMIDCIDTPPLLEMRGIGKGFPGVRALSGVNFDVRAGEVHALVGENGAGKSTLMKILAGAYVADAGEVRLDGRPVRFADPQAALCAGIVTIYQELNLIPALSVAENIFLGDEPHIGASPMIDWPAAHRRSAELLERVGVALNTRLAVGSLGVGQQQLVEVAKALHRTPRLIVMDEPTASLGLAEIDELFRVIRELRARGVSIVYISHRLDEIFAICDRVTVMRDGTVVDTRTVADSDIETLVHMMVGRTLERALRAANPPAENVEVLAVRGLTRRGVFSDVSFRVRRGEIYGLGGVVGSGRTEVARAIFGADPIDGGEIAVDGVTVRIASPRDAVRNGIAMLTEDRKAEGLVLGLSVRVNVALTVLDRIARAFGFIPPARERALAQGFITSLRIRTPGSEQLVVNLSGGNQQKVVLAKWLAVKPKILIFDEPTRGVDVGAKAEIYTLIRELVAQGMAVIVISSELPELLSLSDRIGVLKRGRIVVELDAATTDEATVLAYAAAGKIA